MLRQVCLATLLAQAGAWVPAESLELTPVDAIFVRMGARDAIMSGQVLCFSSGLAHAGQCLLYLQVPGVSLTQAEEIQGRL